MKSQRTRERDALGEDQPTTTPSWCVAVMELSSQSIESFAYQPKHTQDSRSKHNELSLPDYPAQSVPAETPPLHAHPGMCPGSSVRYPRQVVSVGGMGSGLSKYGPISAIKNDEPLRCARVLFAGQPLYRWDIPTKQTWGTLMQSCTHRVPRTGAENMYNLFYRVPGVCAPDDSWMGRSMASAVGSKVPLPPQEEGIGLFLLSRGLQTLSKQTDIFPSGFLPTGPAESLNAELELEVRFGPTGGRHDMAQYESTHPGGMAAFEAMYNALTSGDLASHLVDAGWGLSIMRIESRMYKIPQQADVLLSSAAPNLRARRIHSAPVGAPGGPCLPLSDDISWCGGLTQLQNMTTEELINVGFTASFESIFKTPVGMGPEEQREWNPWIHHGTQTPTRTSIPFNLTQAGRKGVIDSPTGHSSTTDGLRGSAHVETRTGISRHTADDRFQLLSDRTTWRLELVVPHADHPNNPGIRVHMTLNPQEGAVVFEVETMVAFTDAANAYPECTVLVNQVARCMWIVHIMRHWLRGWWASMPPV
jgi:hypothetical protein